MSQIGFVLADTMYPVISVCHAVKQERTFYSNHTLYGKFLHYKSIYERKGNFREGRLYFKSISAGQAEADILCPAGGRGHHHGLLLVIRICAARARQIVQLLVICNVEYLILRNCVGDCRKPEVAVAVPRTHRPPGRGQQSVSESRSRSSEYQLSSRLRRAPAFAVMRVK